MMLLIAFSAAAQEEFFDDVYFSSKNKKKKEQVEEKKVVQPKQESRALVATAKSPASSDSRDVDEYNRRYTSVEVEEPYREDDSVIYEDSDENESSSERRSDTEYTERIIRYHSPSKITIAGADQVDLYLSDGYYGYGYDTDYSNGSANVNFNINVGNGWGSPWYTVGTILGSIAIALGGLIHLASTARLGDSAGAGEAFMPAIIVRGTIHGMARLGAGVEAIGVAIGDIITITIPVTTRLQVDIIQTDVPLIEIIALMRVAEVPVIQVGGAVALLP